MTERPLIKEGGAIWQRTFIKTFVRNERIEDFKQKYYLQIIAKKMFLKLNTGIILHLDSDNLPYFPYISICV